MNLSKSLLAVDIGNNTIDNAIFHGKTVISRFKESNGIIPKYNKYLYNSGLKHEINGLICSVVPNLTNKVILSLRKSHVRSLCIRDLPSKPSISGEYKGLGDDRRVAMWSVLRLYKLPCAVIDLGSAVTIDVINEEGRFKGGMIIPGPSMWVRSLAQGTALLPELRYSEVKRGGLLGKNTKECIRAGLDYGLIDMMDGILDRIEKSLSKRPRIILTGGDCRKISPYLRHKHIVDDLLILKGLRELYDQSGGWNEKSKKGI